MSESHAWLTKTTSSRRRGTRPSITQRCLLARSWFLKKQRITHQSKQLTTRQTLKHYNIPEHITIDVSHELHGGNRRNCHAQRRSEHRKKATKTTSIRSMIRRTFSFRRGHHGRATQKKTWTDWQSKMTTRLEPRGETLTKNKMGL